MNRLGQVPDAFLLFAIWYVVFAAPAHAYFDLNMGTYMLQLIFGFGAAFWIGIKGKIPFLGNTRKKKTTEASSAPLNESGVAGDATEPVES